MLRNGELFSIRGIWAYSHADIGIPVQDISFVLAENGDLACRMWTATKSLLEVLRGSQVVRDSGKVTMLAENARFLERKCVWRRYIQEVDICEMSI